MRIPESFIQEVVLRNPLEEIVSQYATLKRAGSNMVCCCPFHHEKTPSFTLYANPSHYYCYGCGAGGDVITFIRTMENLDYVAAVEYLANRAGLTMPQGSPTEKRVDKKRLCQINAEAARFWHKNLFTPEGKAGLDYLVNRGLSAPIIKRFGLGYADARWDALYNHLKSLGYRDEELNGLFLCRPGKNGRYYDVFRQRVMFPIIDVGGNVLAFSGRTVLPKGPDDQNYRKYVNTNDTDVFKKSQTVFALNIAKNSPEKEIILCEGNMDAVSLHAHGVSNAVASLGTALTPNQCRLIARYTERVSICYDSDEAGRRATEKAIRLLQEAGLRVRVITLSGTDASGKEIKDPDDFIRAFGKISFDKAASTAPGAIEYLFGRIAAGKDLSTMDGKDEFIKECTALFATVQSPVEKELYISRAAEITGIPAQVIRLQTDQKTGSQLRREQKQLLQKEVDKTRGLGNRINPDKAKFISTASKEENVLGILLLRPDYLIDPKFRPLLDLSLFRCEFCKRALQALLDLTSDGEELNGSALNERFSPEEMGEMEGMRKKREELGNNSPEVLRELLERLSEESKKEEIKAEPLSGAWLEKLKAEKSRKDINQ
ncbi:MAG: DNA primase [Clostridia bacterium]|nr:DNA primase [Clostridia bacterium]